MTTVYSIVKVEVKGVGPIDDAELEFTDSVVIVGPNSSGKSTLSSIFYFLVDPFFMNSPILGSRLSQLRAGALDLKDEVEVDIRELVQLNEDRIVDTLKTNIERIVDKRAIREGFEISSEKFRLSLASRNVEVKGPGKLKLRVEYTKGDSSTFSISYGDVVKASGNEDRVREELVSYAISRYFQLEDWIPTIFLSTERISFAQLLPLINYAVFSPAHPSPLKPLALDPLRYTITGEYNVFGHRVVFHDFPHEEIRVFKDGKDIGNWVASGVHQFSFVKAYLSYPWVRGLVVEEPEINLHVDAQIEAASEIARSSKKMFITTHSEWISMVLAYLMKDRVKVYEIVNGKTEERKISEDGWLESLVTISPVERKALEDMIRKVFQ